MEGSTIGPKSRADDTQGDVRSLAELLERYAEASVSDLARLVGVSRGGGHRALCERVARAVLRTNRLQAALGGLSQVEREFLAFIGRLGGAVEPAQAAWWLRRHRIASPFTTTSRLMAEALLFPFWAAPRPASLRPRVALPGEGPEPAPSASHDGLWCPESVWRMAGGAELGVLAVRPEPRRIASAALPDLVRDLFILGRFLSARQPRTTRTSRHLNPAALSELAAALGQPKIAQQARRLEDVPELLWLESVALHAGLIEARDRRLTATAAAQALAQLPPVEQSRRLLEAVVTQTSWGELETVAELSVARPAALSPGELDVPSPGARVRARRRIAEALTQAAAPGAWHRMGDLAEWLMESGPDFLIRRRLPDHATATDVADPIYRGICRPVGGELHSISMVSGWQWVEGAFVAQFLRTALRRVGVVDVAADLFRVTDLGARALGMVGETVADETPPPGRFFVQPNFEIIADGGGDNLAAVARLSQVADLVSFDRAALLRLSRESVCNALDQGLSSAAVMDILDDSGRSPVPQNVGFSIEEWIASHERYQVWTNAWVIETDSPDELDALEGQLPECFERLGPLAARVLPRHRAEVEEALTQRPDLLIVDHAARLLAVFEVDDRLVITPDRSRWHWYPEHVLSQIAEGPGVKRARPRYRLTRESVCRALAGGWTADEIEQFIGQCAAKPLSALQVLLLRGWLGRYGPAALAPAVLLRLAGTARADVLAIPEVREAISGVIASSVYVVRRDAIARVRRLLETAGLTIGDELAPDPLPEPTTAGASTTSVGRDHTWGQRRWSASDTEEAREALLVEVVGAGQPVTIAYRSIIVGEEPQELVVTPERLENSRWGLTRLHAFCHQRREHRTFDVSRIDGIAVLDDSESP